MTLIVAEIHRVSNIATVNVLKTAKAFKSDVFTTHFSLLNYETDVLTRGPSVYLCISNTPIQLVLRCSKLLP